jgi:hypothetical protein
MWSRGSPARAPLAQWSRKPSARSTSLSGRTSCMSALSTVAGAWSARQSTDAGGGRRATGLHREGPRRQRGRLRRKGAALERGHGRPSRHWEESLWSCFVLATSTSLAPSSAPNGRDGGTSLKSHRLGRFVASVISEIGGRVFARSPRWQSRTGDGPRPDGGTPSGVRSGLNGPHPAGPREGNPVMRNNRQSGLKPSKKRTP